jgi:acetamidase/formamidase
VSEVERSKPNFRGLSKTDAYTLCSLAADLHVTQTVNLAKGAHCMLPKAILK